MRFCTLQTVSAESDIKATKQAVSLVSHPPWCATAPATPPIRTKPLAPTAGVRCP